MHTRASAWENLLDKTVKIEINPSATSIIILGNQNLKNRRWNSKPKAIKSIPQLKQINFPTPVFIISLKYALQEKNEVLFQLLKSMSYNSIRK